MKRNNLKKIGIGILSTILFASFTSNVAAGSCADYSQTFKVKESNMNTSSTTRTRQI